MTDLFDAADRADREAARRLLPHLQAEMPITRRMLNDAMVAAFRDDRGALSPFLFSSDPA